MAGIASDDNPLDVITAQDDSSGCVSAFSSRHLRKTFDLKKMQLCQGAMVEYYQTNLKPLWGLYNGAIG
jgi:hypothetical protein